jgi:DNA-binding response OmpR family regulator
MAKVLIIDDDRDLTEAVADALEAEGHESRLAFNGAEGLERIYQVTPDLILLDVEMPVLDGPGFLRRLGSTPGVGAEVVLMSGTPRLSELATALDIRHWIEKPVSYKALLEIVACALNERTGLTRGPSNGER